jgi:hypothetical protein
VIGGNSVSIPFSVFSETFPLAGRYLENHKEEIRENVETFDGDDWHLFTRAIIIKEHIRKYYYL